MSTLRRHLIAPLTEGRTYRRLAFMASAFPLGVAWLVMLVVVWSLGLGLAIVIVGLAVLVGLAVAVRGAAALERALARGLLDVSIAPPVRLRTGGGLLARLRDWVADPTTWREEAYLLARAFVGLPLAAVILGVLATGAQLVAAPAYYWTGALDLGDFWDIDTIGEALLVVPLGAALLLLVAPLSNGLAALWQSGAVPLLAGSRTARPGEAPGPPPVATRARRRGLAVHALVYAGLNLAMIVVWLATTRGHYFWPRWTLAPLGLILAIHALVVFRPPLGRGRAGRVRALELHAGVMGLIALFLTVVWVFTTPGGYFWPAWGILGLAVPVGVHSATVLLRGGYREDELTERIDVLTTTRAGAVDHQAAELRRIERDLHDGAQARLVALAMDLGIARDKLESDPAAAQALVTDAHEEAKRALVELRDLARGIHPAVLTDRGLVPALQSLAGRSRVPVELEATLDERLPAAVEAAAYFVVAEALTNVAKHGGATVVRVRVERRDDRLSLRIVDDGRGGANPAGGGLDGLRRRVEALDGSLTVHSPPGSGTLVSVELPCGS